MDDYETSRNRQLLSDRLWICFIGDGAHVAFYALRNYLRAAVEKDLSHFMMLDPFAAKQNDLGP